MTSAPDRASFANRFQEQFGLPSERVREKVRDRLTPWAQDFIQASPFLVMSTSSAEGRCDASPRGGEPGFVEVIDDHTLNIPDVRGNRLFQSLENLESNPNAGLIFMIPGLNETLRVNGRARVVSADEGARPKVQNPDAGALRLQTIRIQVGESYVHCPRAYAFSDLWNSETIERHQEERPISPYSWSEGEA